MSKVNFKNEVDFVNHVNKCRRRGTSLIQNIFSVESELILKKLKSIATKKKNNGWRLSNDSAELLEHKHIEFIYKLNPTILKDAYWGWVAIELYYRSWLVDFVYDNDDWILDIYDESCYFN